MSGSGLSIDVSDSAGVVMLTVTGDLDYDSSPTLERALRRIEPDRDAVLDVRGVPFMDSGGLRVVLDYANRFLRGGGDMSVRPSLAVRHLLRIAGVEHLVHTDAW